MPAPVAAVRLAVRRYLAAMVDPAGHPAAPADPPTGSRERPDDSVVLVACSGGPDSLALAAATAFVAPRLGLVAGLVTVDHGLQDGSPERARAVAAWAVEAGFGPVEVATVDVAGLPGGPEAAARTARYAALSAAADRLGAAAVLLGHTRDDQAETVLLAMARGAGPRGLAGMPQHRGVFVRPLLDVSRADTRKACAALGLATWEDPHNTDPAYARSRVRADALPALIAALGPAVVDNLARTAAQAAADNKTLDALAVSALATARVPSSEPLSVVLPESASVSSSRLPSEPASAQPGPIGLEAGPSGAGLSAAVLGRLPVAVRTRVLHAWARELGAPGGALSHRHVAALDALVQDWHGQGPVALPGAILISRLDGVLRWVEPAL